MPEHFPDVPPKEPVIVENDLEFSVTADDVDWSASLQDDRFNFPEGTQAKVVHEDPSEGRVEKLVKFDPGFVEPRHSHEGGHAVLVLDGKMEVHGETLTSGDYLYGQQVPHGPMEYPEGCMVFASFVGGSASLEWDEEDYE